MTDDELLRLACIYAERDQLEYLAAWSRCDDAGARKVKRETVAFIKRLRAYRLKRWGKTVLEKMMEGMVSVPVADVAGRKEPSK